MKRIMMLGAVVILLATAVASHSGVLAETPATPEPNSTDVSAEDIDALWDTIDALETRVADLEAEVAELRTRLDSEGSNGVSISGPTHTVEVTLTIIGGDHIIGTGSNCQGDGGYDDLRVGAAVTVMDQSGRVIANGYIDSAKGTSYSCELSATIKDVPEVDFYQFKISHRGGPSYSLADMEAADWKVDLSIGT